MATLLCPKCWKAHKDNGWYMSGDYKKTANVPDCLFHPTLTSWRLLRTLKTLRVWSLEHEGFIHKNCPSVRLTLIGGHIHRRTAEAILFDYEKPFIELLLEEGYLTAHKDVDGVANTLTVNAKADDFIRANLKAKEKEAQSA